MQRSAPFRFVRARAPGCRPKLAPGQLDLPGMGDRFRLAAPAAHVVENDVEDRLAVYFARRGWTMIRQHVGLFKSRAGQYVKIGERGMTDYLVTRPIRPGLTLSVYVEVKAPGCEPSDEQLRWMRRQQALGHYAVWFDSVEACAAWFEARFGPRLDRLLMPSGTAAPTLDPASVAAGWRLTRAS